jgi:hypothetical protein
MCMCMHVVGGAGRVVASVTDSRRRRQTTHRLACCLGLPRVCLTLLLERSTPLTRLRLSRHGR